MRKACLETNECFNRFELKEALMKYVQQSHRLMDVVVMVVVTITRGKSVSILQNMRKHHMLLFFVDNKCVLRKRV